MPTFFKIFGWFFSLLFLFSAILQYNDPDPLIWIAIYVAATALSVGFALGKMGPLLPLVAGILALAGAFYTFPAPFVGFEFQQGMINNEVEAGSEAFGLFIVSVVMFVYVIASKFGKQ